MIMAKSQSQKLKLIQIIKILEEKSDIDHPISTKELIQRLGDVGILAERKSIYDDISQLCEFGYSIELNKAKTGGGYYLKERLFELAELKLLVDAVQASKFITRKKTNELISKIETLTNIYKAKQLQRHVYVNNRIKTVNENIYENVDSIHQALSENVRVTFRYFEWSEDKTMNYRKGGALYEVSPWALTFSEENYYLVGFEEASSIIKHYRVDKMTDLLVTDRKRLGKEQFEKFDIATYANKTFGMYGGDEEMITLQFSGKLIGVVIDRFGKDVSLRKRGDDLYSVRIPVAVSNQFFGWLAGLGSEAMILSPEHVNKEYREYLQKIISTNTYVKN